MAVSLIDLRVTFIVAYFAPGHKIDDIFNVISDCLSSVTNNNVILAGDFNARLDSGKRGHNLVQLMLASGYHCISDWNTPTYYCHNGHSVIDLIFTNIASAIDKLTVFPSPITKHCVVQAKLSIQHAKNDYRSKPLRNCDVDLLAQMFGRLQVQDLTASSLNSSYDLFLSILVECEKVKKVRKSKEWFDKECYEAHKRWKQTYHLYHAKGNNADLNRLAIEKRHFKQLCRRKKRVLEEIRVEKLLCTAEDDRSKFWNILKVRQQKAAKCHVKPEDWSTHFDDLYNADNPSTFSFVNHQTRGAHDYISTLTEPLTELDDDISLSEITEAIAKSPNKKAAGPDGITNEYLKQSFGIIYPFLLSLFIFCFRTASCPSVWRTAHLMPLYKGKGEKTNPNSYRGISLFSCLYKCYTSILHKRLSTWAEYFNILPDSQHGFRRGRSTITATKALICMIRDRIDRYKCCYVCFVDYEKAFDKVDRKLLFSKLQKYGLTTHFTKVLYEIYSQNNIRVSVDNYLSEIINQKIGVPQGDKLSPLLFAIFIADLSSILEKTGCFVVFYADDLAIGSHNRENLVLAMSKLEEYCKLNFMAVNVGKTKVVKFRKGGKLMQDDVLFYKNEKIEFVNSFEYLGIILSSKLTPRAHIDHLTKKAKTTICSLQSKTVLAKISFESAKRLFIAVVVPAATYGLEVFGSSITEEMYSDFKSKISGMFVKKWLGISTFSSTRKILYNVLDNDFLDVQNCHPGLRRMYGLFYNNGLHNLLCVKPNCYTVETHNLVFTTGFTLCETCRCHLCQIEIVDDRHLLTCSAFNSYIPLTRRIFQMYASVN